MDGTNWVVMMNYSLIAVVVLAWSGLFISIGWELSKRLAVKMREMKGADSALSALLAGESHRMTIPELGLTMADGGEELKASDHDTKEKKTDKE